MQGSAISTQNKRGFTYELTSFGKAFIDASAKATKPVMDIGAAYGVATIPALEAGASVIAVDIDEQHLLEIRRSVNTECRNRLVTLKEKFPAFEMPPSSLSAVYMSQVLPFLTGKEIEEGARKIFDWLTPGGKVFIVSFTPYISHVASFIPIYEEQKRLGKRWAGYIDDVLRYSNDPNIYLQLPKQINHINADDLQWAYESAGFIIDENRFFNEEEGALPQGIRYDGRERVGMIAHKPGVFEIKKPEKTYWQKVSAIKLEIVPQSVRDWLHKPYVLSTALRKVCDDFKVQVNAQGTNMLYSDEIEAMKSFDTPYGFVRETYLGGKNNPVVYARVSMPLTTYHANKEALDNLGNRPIGETILYSHPDFHRSELEVKKLSQDDELLFNSMVHDNYFQAEIEKNSSVRELWARRSLFSLSGNPLLITEVFLVNIPKYQE